MYNLERKVGTTLYQKSILRRTIWYDSVYWYRTAISTWTVYQSTANSRNQALFKSGLHCRVSEWEKLCQRL